MTDPTPTPEARLAAHLAELDQTFHDWIARSRRDHRGNPEADVKIALRAHALFRMAFSTLHRPGQTNTVEETL